MKTLKLIFTCSALTLMIGTSFSLYAGDTQLPPRIIDAGPDGDERFYSVICSDGTQTAVMKSADKKTVCAKPDGQKKDVCKEWSVDEAAHAACGYKRP